MNSPYMNFDTRGIEFWICQQLEQVYFYVIKRGSLLGQKATCTVIRVTRCMPARKYSGRVAFYALRCWTTPRSQTHDSDGRGWLLVRGVWVRILCMCVGGEGSIRETEIADARFKKALMLSDIHNTKLENLLQLDGRRKSHSVGPTQRVHSRLWRTVSKKNSLHI